MSLTRTRSLAAIAAGALLLATLAGCGGSDDKKPDAKKSEPTSTATADLGDDTSTAGTKELAEEEADGKEIEDTAAFLDEILGKVREAKTSHIVMDLGSSMQANADVRYGADAGMHMTMTAGGQTVDAILIGNTIYIKNGPTGKYLKIDSSTGGSEAVLAQLRSLTPEKSLGELRKALRKIVDVGSASGKEIGEDSEEKLDKYVLTVDNSKLTQQLGQGVVGSDAPKGEGKYALYVDSDGMLRAIQTDVSGQKVLLKFSDWGKDVVLKAPPASQISSLPAS